MKIAILGSTKGTDMIGIIDAINNNTLSGIDIAFVLSNKENAYILERARQYNLNAIFLNPKGKSREEYDDNITTLLENNGVELILLIGYMKLMSEKFVNRWRNKVMNIHPSLLPAFAGSIDRNVHADVLERGCKISGATLMFIDQGADTGPIISQRVCTVEQNDDVDSLKAKVQILEQELLVEALALYRDNSMYVVDKKVYFL